MDPKVRDIRQNVGVESSTARARGLDDPRVERSTARAGNLDDSRVERSTARAGGLDG